MQGAGADPIRIGVDSWVSGGGGDITVDGRKVSAPFRVVAPSPATVAIVYATSGIRRMADATRLASTSVAVTRMSISGC